MSPAQTQTGNTNHGFPRVSGDEPDTTIEELRSQVFSPRERG